jgi:chromosome segregation ATPase|nr:MAG TPA_asm: tail tape measure [Caudoviricetes sp.]
MPNINTKFTLSGEKEYKQAISEIGSGMKVLDAEMRKVTSAYGKNAESAKLLGQQNDILQRQIYSQTEKIRYMQEALKNSVKKTGESSKATMAWQASLQNATAKLNDLNNQMRENEQRMNGEKERKYRENIERLSASMDVLDAEMRKVSAKYADNAESAELSAAKTDLLTQKISLQYDKIDNLKAGLEEAAENYGSNAVETLRWEKELNNAEAELYKLNGQLKNNTEQIEDTTTATEDAGQSMGNLGDVVNGLTSKLGIQLPDGMKSSMNAMGSLDAQSLALAGGFAAVAAAIVKVEKAMISMTKESAAFADNIITLSMQTGQSTQQLQEFAYASELIDVSVDTLQGSLTKLTNNMQDTMNGTGNAKASFDKLGVSVINAVDGSMRSANDVFYETIDALGQVKNETERDAMAMDIFGRSAQDLNPLIIQGSKTLKAYADEAHNVGYVLDDEALSTLGAVDDAYQRLQKTQEGVKNQLSAEFAPYLEEFYGDVTTMVKDGGKALKDSGLVDAFGMLLETVGDILNPMSDLSNNRVPALTKALQPLAKVMALMADAAELLKGVINFSTGHISEGWGQMTHALGFGYSSGNGNNYQNLLDSYTEQQWGQSAADLSKAYEDAIARGDPSTIGITEDEWVRRYLGGNASGTDNWRGGWTRVNENGLERIFLPSGSRIQTASETRYTSGDTYNTTVYVDHVDDLDTILRIAKNARITARMGAK